MFSLLLNDVDISTSVLRYHREQAICTGIGTLEVSLVATYPGSIEIWDEVTLYENSNKKGEFFISEISHEAAKGVFTLICQDGSKKLTDYFIVDTYDLDYITYTRYWIEKFLEEAGINYTITDSGEGAPLSSNTTLGMGTAYDIITQLVQQSGWYFYFNANSECIIGKLSGKSSTPDATLTDAEILNIYFNRNDKMLRNRAVVWGNADPITGQWVFADIHVKTPYDYDTADIRTVLLSNSNIYSTATANSLARKMIREFKTITKEKTVKVAGEIEVTLGDLIFINSTYMQKTGLITSLQSECSENGLFTTLNLDERCPRLFGHIDYLNPIGSDGYVYIGTYGSGIWRKTIIGSTWENYSTGLTDLNIIDLDVNDGTLVCVTASGLAFMRTIVGSTWIQLSVGTVEDAFDNTFYTDLLGVACHINIITGEIYVGYRLDSLSTKRSWIAKFSSSGVFETLQVFTDSYSHEIKDIEAYGLRTQVTTVKSAPNKFRNSIASLYSHHGVNNPESYNTTSSGSSYTELQTNSKYYISDSQHIYYCSAGSVTQLTLMTGATVNIPIPDATDIFGLGLIEDGIVVILWEEVSQYSFSTVNFNTSTVTLLTTLSIDNLFEVRDSLIVALDGNSLIKIFAFTIEGTDAGFTHYKLYTHIYNYNTSSYSKVEIFSSQVIPCTNSTMLFGTLITTSNDALVLTPSQIAIACWGETNVALPNNYYYAAIVLLNITFYTIVNYTWKYDYDVEHLKPGISEMGYDANDGKIYFSGYELELPQLSYWRGNITSGGVVTEVQDTVNYSMYELLSSNSGAYLWVSNGNNIYNSSFVLVATVNGNQEVVCRVVDDADQSIYYFNRTTGNLYKEGGSLILTTTLVPLNLAKGTYKVSMFAGHFAIWNTVGVDQSFVYYVAASDSIANINALLRENSTGNFTEIITTSPWQQIENSEFFPTVLFRGLLDDPFYSLGYLYIENEDGTFSNLYLPTDGFINDARVFDLMVENEYTQYLAITQPAVAGNGSIKTLDLGLATYSISDLEVMQTFEGEVSHFETSYYSYTTTPHMFVSISGVLPKFFQRNRDTSGFTEYSTGLPETNITAIRLDNRV